MRDPGVTTGRRGFTQTEMVVVIGIMAVLVALLMPSLGSAIKTARKLEDLNRLRQIGMAWTQYSQMHDDAVLPGYLSVAAQDDWNVQYRYADGEVMSPAPNYTPTGDPEGNMAGPWVWRLMPYLDFDFDVMLGYLGDEGGKIDTRRRALDIRRQPAFAYNSIFVGGWWYGPREYWYKNAKRLDTDERISVVSRTQGSIRNPSRLVTCTSAASRTPGVQKYNAVRDDFDGTYSVLPPIMGRHRVWGLADDPNYAAASDVIQLQAVDWFTEFEESGCPFAIPIGRSNAKASVLFADGHADDRFTSTLTDMRHWADAADGRNFMFDR